MAKKIEVIILIGLLRPFGKLRTGLTHPTLAVIFFNYNVTSVTYTIKNIWYKGGMVKVHGGFRFAT